MNKQYDFDTIIDRRGTNSVKWNAAENELPMWVADMDFTTAPEITNAIAKRAAFGIFGYEAVPEEWYRAIQGWWKERHRFTIDRDWLLFCTGVVPAISSVIRKLTAPGEKVLLQPPVYHVFYNCIIDNGRLVERNELHYEQGTYHLNFEDLEQKLSDPQVTMMLLCNPHNPVGKLWDRETLERIGALCLRHHVLVLSDEIHCDLTDPGCEYIPFAAISEDCARNSVTCIAPTKTFNLAGMKTSAVIVPDETIRQKVWQGLKTDEIAEANSFAVTSAVAAFTEGGPWLDALREYLYENKRVARDFIARELPQITVAHPQATYLLWLDCANVSRNPRDLGRFLREKAGLWLSDGHVYGGNGEQFLRMNVACPRSRLLDGLQRLQKGIAAFESGEDA